MNIVDPNSLPLDHPALVPDMWVHAMLSHPLVTKEAREQALETAQLTITEGENDYLFVTQNHEAVLVTALSETLSYRYFGAEAGLLLDPAQGSILTYMLLAADNLRDLLGLLERYSSITRINSMVRVQETADGVSVIVAYDTPVVHRLSQYIEFAVSAVVGFLRVASGQNLNARTVRLVHDNPVPDACVSDIFSCAVEYGAHHNEVIFDASILDLEVVSSDARLLKYLRSYGNILLKNRHPERTGIRTRIEEVILERLPYGVPSMEETSKCLGVSARTMSRRLADHGTSFREIVDRLRYDLAMHHLADPKLTLADIAYLLGYADQSSFGAAFRRMSEKTPLQVREMLGFSPTNQLVREK
ncbi:helix-turn-helix domain-containing protein [Shimia thalassica]|uniref:helix-turn-helix domain-containing protein n=1 Tax=Shimia thalassica TaxID=1715693 RepID=UPI0026E2CC68|nr:AraC family transcriptional regulator [Shimia thalassica]MDO6480867.1 AraC family transcriptional regulator ligand-binding domain-containing protein [Shimia thalassica]